MKNRLLLGVALCLSIGVVPFVVGGRDNKLFNVSATEECSNHNGNHYDRKDPTETESGWQEFWACCVCNHQYLTLQNGKWTNANSSMMTGGIDSDHIAYLPPTSITPISLYKNTYELCRDDRATIDFNENNLSKFGTITYTTNNDNVVVSNNGIITAKKLGTSIVTIKGSNYGEAKVTVNVTNNEKEMGYTLDLIEEPYSYSGIIHNREELNFAMCYLTTQHYKYANFNVELTSSINDEEFSGFFEMRDIAPAYLWSNRYLPLNTWNSLTVGSYYEELPVGNYKVYVSFGYAQEIGYSNASETSPVNGHEVTELINIESEIRRYENSLKSSLNKRDANFKDFPMYQVNNKGYFEVRNCEELWWSVANGYIPRFPLSHSTAEDIFEKAKDILRKEITNDMSDTQKMLAIYDYMSENLRYDYEALDCEIWLNNTAWYLEGPFYKGRCVCDSFSRMYSLLCNIEGLGIERGCGHSTSGGHAWNYAKVADYWYLTCTTWSQTHLNSNDYSNIAELMGVTTPYFEITSYSTFLTDLLYMEANDYSRDYKDIIHNSHTITKALSYSTIATFGNNYDFKIDSVEEMRAIFTIGHSLNLTKFYLEYVEGDYDSISNVMNSLNYSGYTSVNYSGFYMGNSIVLFFDLSL